MKYALLLTVCIFCLLLPYPGFGGVACRADAASNITPTDTAKPAKTTRYARRMKNLGRDPLFIGAAFAVPQLRYGYKATQPWFGPSFMVMGGFFHYSFLRGMAEVADSGKVFQSRGMVMQFDFKIPLATWGSPRFEVVPNFGFGFQFQSLEDKRRLTPENESVSPNQFGLCLSPGVSVKMGPVIGQLSYNVNVGANFDKRNAFNFFTHYPSVGFYMSAMPILMNPKDFSSTGLRHYKDLVGTELTNSGIMVNRKIAEDQNTITYRREQIKWVKSTYADRYEEESVKCKDVRPFTYIGPRVSTTWYNSDQMAEATNVGVNAGFRYGMWWVNGFAEQGSVFVKGPPTEGLHRVYNSGSFPNLSGGYKNTTKVGGQLGIELISRAKKSDFKPYSYQQAKEIKSVTSFVGIIPYVGYGVSRLGTFSYNSPTGAADMADYQTRPGHTELLETAKVAGSQTFVNFGGCLHIGAAVFGLDWYLYPDAKKLNSRQIYVGLNLPVARLVRSLAVRRYVNKIKKMEG